MNAGRDLTEAYQEWHRLAEAEGQAIGARDWGLVSACQKAIQHLQERISQMTPAARAEGSQSGGRPAASKVALTAAIHELIQLEKRNQTLLGVMQTEMRAKLDQLDQAGQNLKQIRRSYGAGCPAGWSSFS
jgi:hypothetical protein